MSEKKVVDWDLIEVDYRAGIKPLRLIAEENGLTHGAINKRAKRDGWSRDLAAKIKAKAEEKVSKAAVSAEVSSQKLATESQVVEANAEVQFRVRMEHRQDIGRTRALFRALLEEVEVATNIDGRALIEKLAEVLSPAKPDETQEQESARLARMSRLLDKVMSGPSRIDSTKKLAEILEKLVKMEREAFGIGGEEKGTSELDALLIAIGRGTV